MFIYIVYSLIDPKFLLKIKGVTILIYFILFISRGKKTKIISR